jgi:hypothetical protein
MCSGHSVSSASAHQLVEKSLGLLSGVRPADRSARRTGAADGDLKLPLEVGPLMFVTVLGLFCLTVYVIGPATWRNGNSLPRPV